MVIEWLDAQDSNDIKLKDIEKNPTSFYLCKRKAHGKIIKEPILVSGNYLISIFLGDGIKDMFTSRDCISLEYLSENHKYKSSDSWKIGSVLPIVKYEFDFTKD